MTFRDLFYSSLTNLKLFSDQPTFNSFLPKETYIDSITARYFLYTIAAGKLSVPAGANYSLNHLPAYCIIHVLTGDGQYIANELHTRLFPGSLLLIDCRNVHSISALSDWEYEVIFFDGTLGNLYYEKISANNSLLLPGTPDTLTVLACRKLCQSSSSSSNSFTTHKLLTDILTSFVNSSENSNNKTAPEYLVNIRQEIESNYFNKFTLEQMAASRQVNKYRFCKEFKHYYGLSPLQYLHHIRIQNAQSLLEDTSMKILEISYSVGYENVNLFIRHFKKITGFTPSAFRNK